MEYKSNRYEFINKPYKKSFVKKIVKGVDFNVALSVGAIFIGLIMGALAIWGGFKIVTGCVGG